MPKTRAEKAEIVAKVADRFKSMKAAAFSSVTGYTMVQADALREQARAANVDVFVTKKTLLRLAAKEAGLPELSADILDGSVLTAVAYNDEVSAAKLLKALTKENEGMALLGGILEGLVIDAAGVNRLAALPTKQQLLGQLVGVLNAPVSGFVTVLAGNLHGLVTVMTAIKDKKV
jgi:large subunit ribosomal protein L10